MEHTKRASGFASMDRAANSVRLPARAEQPLIAKGRLMSLRRKKRDTRDEKAASKSAPIAAI